MHELKRPHIRQLFMYVCSPPCLPFNLFNLIWKFSRCMFLFPQDIVATTIFVSTVREIWVSRSQNTMEWVLLFFFFKSFYPQHTASSLIAWIPCQMRIASTQCLIFENRRIWLEFSTRRMNGLSSRGVPKWPPHSLAVLQKMSIGHCWATHWMCQIYIESFVSSDYTWIRCVMDGVCSILP